MEVNEKCDVYSFGVVTLEVIMGNHPGDLISCLPLPSLSSSQAVHNQILFRKVLDQRLPPPRNQIANQVVSVANTAFACLQANPQSRPTMKQVSDIGSFITDTVSASWPDYITAAVWSANLDIQFTQLVAILSLYDYVVCMRSYFISLCHGVLVHYFFPFPIPFLLKLFIFHDLNNRIVSFPWHFFGSITTLSFQFVSNECMISQP